MAAAGRVLRDRGLEGARVREIAAAAGVSPGTVLYHFGSTDDLLFAVHEDAVARYSALRTAAAAGHQDDPWLRLVATFKVGLPPYADREVIELLYEMHRLGRKSPRHAVLLSGLWRLEYGLYVELVSAGVARGVFRCADPAATARTLLALEDGLVLHLISGNEAVSSPLALTTFLTAAAHLLGDPALAASGRYA